MKVNYSGCALCDSRWGQLWAEVEGTRLFFCCSICEVEFRGLVERIRRSTRWDQVDSLTLEGDRRGRHGRANRGEEVVQFQVAFTPEGAVRRFELTPEHPASA